HRQHRGGEHRRPLRGRGRRGDLVSEPVEVRLRTPITLGSETIESLTVRPCTGRDLRKLPVGSELDVLLALAGRLTGQTDAVIDRLAGADLEEVVRVVSGFAPDFRPTGEKPSGS